MNTFLLTQGVTEADQYNVRQMAGVIAIEALADLLYYGSYRACTKTRTMGAPTVRITVTVEKFVDHSAD